MLTLSQAAALGCSFTSIKTSSGKPGGKARCNKSLFTGKVGASGSTKKDIVATYDMTVFASGFNNVMGLTIQAHATSGRQKPTLEAKNSSEDALGLYRFLYLRDEEARKEDQLQRSVKRAISERLRNMLSYHVTL